MRRFFQFLRRAQSQPKRHTARLRLEILEDRTAPALVTTPAGLIPAFDTARFGFFTNTAVSTQAGLIAAINADNASGGINYISLLGNITLNETSPFMSADGATGLPAITNGDNLTIYGNNDTLQRSFNEGDADFRLFDVDPGASLTLDQMNLAGGLETGPIATGGAIEVHATGSLTLNGDTISNSDVSYTGGGSTTVVLVGGAIYNAGTVNVVNSLIQTSGAHFTLNHGLNQGDNQGNSSAAGNSGNGAGNGLTGDVLVQGGGIYNTGNLTITSTSILDNVAIASITNGSLNPGDVDGNGNFNGSNDATANNGNGNGNGVVGNVTVQGGGIFNVEVLSITGGTISGNAALCNVTNGSNNGNNNSDTNSGDNNGDDNGNGVTGTVVTGSVDVTGGNIYVAGGGIYNNDQLTAVNVHVTENVAICSVTNGSNNGGDDAVGTDSFDGDNNGTGVVGNILVSGGGIANDSAGSATLSNGSSVTQNLVSCSISNGSNNGSGDGDNNTGNNEGKNNGNGVDGFVVVSGGGLDNESSANLTVFGVSVSSNSATSTVVNGSSCGDNDGDSNGANDGDGVGLASDLTLHGGGIRNAGTLHVFNATFTGNSATSFISNGSNNGNGCGNNDGEEEEGRSNGDAVTGDVLIAGGAIANSGSLGVLFGTFTFNSLNSTVINGANDGNNDGDNDADFPDCGDNGGNGIGEGANSANNGQVDLEIDGGAIGNSGTAVLIFSTITNNGAFSTISNGAPFVITNGIGDGVGSTPDNNTGVGNGNGVHGNMEVIGGGTANVGTLSFFLCNISGNSVSSNVTTGAGDTAINGQLVDGTVTVGNPNTF